MTERFNSANGTEPWIQEVREQLRDLLAATSSSAAPPEKVHAELERLAAEVDALAARAAADRAANEADAARVAEVMDVLCGLAALDFQRRASVVGDGPFDALAVTANMLAEELEATQRSLNDAKATAEAATAAKSRFLASMSHEIRTPLTALLGFSDLLAAPTLADSDRLNYARIIHRNGEHLLTLINDILDLSKVEAGRLALERVDCSLVELLGDLVSLMRARATASGLDFQVLLETPIPRVVRSDPTRLRQILLNLIGNAIKFTRSGGVTVAASFDAGAAPPRLVFAVRDTGIGMTAAQIAGLYQPFEQGDASLTRRFGGSGLGLAISKLLAAALGGDIAAQSTPGVGSTFTLTVPVEVPPGTPAIADREEVTNAAPRARAGAVTPRLSGRILLAEDGVDNQVLLTALLHQLGLDVAVVSEGRAAVERALAAAREGAPFDVVLMDMQMPVLDGYQATAELRGGGYRGAILAVTAHAMAGERERCLAAGCDDYLRKPVELADLAAAVERHLAPGREGTRRTAQSRPGPDPAPAPLRSRYAGDPDMREAIAHFVGRIPERLAGIRAEARARGAAGLARHAHQLKGAAGGFGFPEVSELAARLEHAVHQRRDWADVEELIDELERMGSRIQEGA